MSRLMGTSVQANEDQCSEAYTQSESLSDEEEATLTNTTRGGFSSL